MKSFYLLAAATLAVAMIPASSPAQAVVGSPAPAFTATDSHGQSQSLSESAGKFVVLEWHNHDCPYTRKHYDSGNMEALQKEWTAKGVIWFTVISSAPGQQGYMTEARRNRISRRCTPIRRRCSWIPKASSATCTTPKPRPRCTSSIPKAS